MRGIVVPVLFKCSIRRLQGIKISVQKLPSRGSVIRGGVGRPVSELTPVTREAVPRAGFGPLGPHTEPEGARPGGLLGPFP